MTWDETIALLHGTDWKSVKAGLNRISELLHLLDDPHKKLRFVHIAGTNGKGSAAAMLAEILTEAGYRTGRYISPHLVRMNERFCVNGEPIRDADLRETASIVRAAAEQMIDKPTNFELLTALSFVYFLRQHCDIVVLEVGLGGRLDATNVIDHSLVSLIMHIGLEHTAELGDTVEQIAYEKAGIIKQGGDVVLYAQMPEVEGVVSRIAAEREARLTVTDQSRLDVLDRGDPESATPFSPDQPDPDDQAVGNERFSGQIFTYRSREELHLSLLGRHQTNNAAVVLDAVDILRERHGYEISEAVIRKALSTVNWPGRFQVLSRDPLLVVDGAHNPNGMQALAESIRLYFAGRRMIFLMGVMADKNYRRMLDILAEECGDIEVIRFIAEAPHEERALRPEQLKTEISRRFRCPVDSCDSVREGIKLALKTAAEAATDRPVILAFGSLYQVGEILAIYESM